VLPPDDRSASRAPSLRDSGFLAGGVGERREEENGRRGYGKRAGTSCEVRAARREIISFAIDRAKKGRRTSAGEGLPLLLAVARPVEKSRDRTRTRRCPTSSLVPSSLTVRPTDRSGALIRRLKKKRSRAEFSRRKGLAREVNTTPVYWRLRRRHRRRRSSRPVPFSVLPRSTRC